MEQKEDGRGRYLEMERAERSQWELILFEIRSHFGGLFWFCLAFYALTTVFIKSSF